MNNFVATIYSLVLTVFLADSSSTSKAQEVADPSLLQSIIDFLEKNSIVAIIVTVGTIVLNLDRIISFWGKFFKKEELKSSEEEALRYRKKLLEIIQGDVEQRRKNSLHNLIQIDIRKEEQRQQIGKRTQEELAPEDPVVESINLLNLEAHVFGQETGSEVPSTVDFYTRLDIKRRLLILGEPGSGKTTELLDLAQELIRGARLDVNKPIPIIFELSAWQEDKSIKDWMLEQLPKLYQGLPKEVAEYWLKNQQILPLLDGLDELGLVNQKKCMVAINEFLENRFETGLVVCCRREEYEQADIELNRLQGAIYLLPLASEQIQQYLQGLNREYIWNETIVDQPILKELVSKPLFLSILVVAYQGKAISNSTELFEQYTNKQLNNPDSQGVYPPNKNPSQAETLHYLIWLANRLEEKQETEFLIEHLQPSWLSSQQQKRFYQLIYGLTVGLTVGLISGLTVGLNLGLFFGLFGGIVGLILEGIDSKNIKPLEKTTFSFKIFLREGLREGLIYGLTIGLIFWLGFWLVKGLTYGLIVGLSGGLIYGLIVGLSGGLIYGLTGSKMENKNYPNQGVWNSLRNGLVVGLIFGLSVYLNAGIIWGMILRDSGLLIWGVILGLTGGVSFGMIFGLNAAIRHFTLRLLLYKNGYIPWSYAKFLDHAVKHRFIQRVGGRYRFMHDLLRKHFANMKLS